LLAEPILHFAERYGEVEAPQAVLAEQSVCDEVGAECVPETARPAKCPQIAERTDSPTANTEDDAAFVDVGDLAAVLGQLADAVKKRLASHEAAWLVTRQCHLNKTKHKFTNNLTANGWSSTVQ